ncbi:MAG: site-specific DNA-methyltransferase [Bacillota bacterium]
MAGKYDNRSKEELIRIIERRDCERRLGLVWEREAIEPEKLVEGIPVLRYHPELSVGAGVHRNMIIEGENYYALKFLRSAFAGEVKCIIIDPPYNTGEKDFVYNDSYYDKENRFFWSTWLEFMYRRLQLARELLRDDGVIFVHINGKAMPYLSLLMGQVFPGQRVGEFVWRCRTGANDSKNYFLSEDHEYVLCFANPKFTFGGIAKNADDYSNPDDDPRGVWTYGDLTKAHNYLQRPNTYYHLEQNGVFFPCNPNRVWAFATLTRLEGKKVKTKTMEQLIAEKRVLFPEHSRTVLYNTFEEVQSAVKDGTAPPMLSEAMPDLNWFVGKTISYERPKYKRYFSELKKSDKPLSTWIVAKDEMTNDEEVERIFAGLTSEGTKTLKTILGENAFSYPKPPSLIKNLIAQATSGSADEIVLDFFAGSGTAAQAALELNNEDDGGNRRFIMVSAAEATAAEPDKNVCRNVCRERVKRVIEGYNVRGKGGFKQIQGTGGDFAYFSINNIAPENYDDFSAGEIWAAVQYDVFGDYLETSCADGLYSRVDEFSVLIYLDRVTEDTLARAGRLVAVANNCVIYSWQPELVRERLGAVAVIEKLPDYVIEKYGQRR